jgi:ribokinase
VNPRGAKIFVIGSYMHAFVIRTARFPREGETVFGSDSEIGPGGKGSNQAIGMVRLGARVDMLAAVGADVFGEEARSLWNQEGIEGRWINTSPEDPTGMAFIVVNGEGQNCIIVDPGANASLDTGDVERAEEAIASASVVVAQFESPAEVVERAFEVAKAHNVMTILNPAPARRVSDHLLSLVDVATPNEEEAKDLAGLPDGQFAAEPAARALRARGVKTLVLTLGAAGAYVLDDSGGRTIPGIQVSVVDTTGAGDAFTAALAVALSAGEAIDDAVQFANLAGAYCVTRSGVVPGLGNGADLTNMHDSFTVEPHITEIAE